jgi:uncharacterized membrane protein YjjP (DUF1212 family)
MIAADLPRLRRPRVATAAWRDDEAVYAFVLALARALHRYGTPANRLEEAMAVVCKRLGIEAEVFSTPTTIIASFGKPAELRTRMMRVDGGELDMAKLAHVDALADAVVAKELTPEEAMRRLDAIEAQPPAWGRLATALSHAVLGAAVTVFFHGSWRDVIVAGIIGLVLGVLGQRMAHSSTKMRVYELVGAFIGAFTGGAAAALWTGVSSSVVTVAGIIVLLPGLSLTVAMTELATRNLISGTARLMAAVIVLLELVVGVAIGERAARAVFDVVTATPVPLPAWSEWLAVFVAGIAMTVIVQAEKRALGWILAACVVGVAGARAGTSLLGPELGALGGAVALGVLGNAYARILDRPSQVIMVPAMILLVPGSVGFRGMSSLLDRDTLSGVETTFAMFVVAMAIVGGLLIANAVLSPRRVL